MNVIIQKTLSNIKKLSDMKHFILFLNYILLADCYLNVTFNKNIFNLSSIIKDHLIIENLIIFLIFIGFYTAFISPLLVKFLEILMQILPTKIMFELYSMVDINKMKFPLEEGFIKINDLRHWAIMNKNKLAYSMWKKHQKMIDDHYRLSEISFSLLVLLGINFYIMNGTIMNEYYILVNSINNFASMTIKFFAILFMIYILYLGIYNQLIFPSQISYIYFPEHDYVKEAKKKLEDKKNTYPTKDILTPNLFSHGFNREEKIV